MKKEKVGFILGKFYPMHIGHVSLIEMGLNLKKNGIIDKLIVLIDNHESYDLPLETREAILKEEFPEVEIRSIKESTRQEPDGTDSFWDHWNDVIKKYIKEDIECIIGSMGYIKKLSSVLGCKYILVDENREGINFSATKFRDDPLKNWNLLANSSKKFLSKKVAIVGPESAGKTTLVKYLAKRFNTNYTPEYGRSLVENLEKKEEIINESFLNIQKVHFSHSLSLSKFCNYIHFLDTEAITTKLWSDILKKDQKENLDLYIEKQNIDLFLVVKPRKEWQEDKVRYTPEYSDRIEFYENLIKELEIRKLKFETLEGSSFERNKEIAVNKIKKEFSELG